MKPIKALPAQKLKSNVRLPVLASSCIIAALHALPVNAELKIMDDGAMSQVTGQAGLTIDIETEVHIAEIEYVDAGSIYTKDYSLTAIGGGLVDNVRAVVDIAGGSELLATGFSDIARMASMGFFDPNQEDVAWAINEYSDGFGGFGKQYDDGDLVIHVASQDYGLGSKATLPADPNDHAVNLENFKNAIDLHIQEGEFGIRSSDGLTETTLTKNFSVEAYLGYLDIIIRNDGNDFHQTANIQTDGKPSSLELADSFIDIDLKFRVDDLDVDSTNNAMNTIIPRAVTTPYLTLRDMRIHNERGLDTEGSFGFASLEAKMSAVKGIVADLDSLNDASKANFVDGQAFYDVNVKMDWDLPHVSFGNTGVSIGKVYFTDFHINDTSVVISAH